MAELRPSTPPRDEEEVRRSLELIRQFHGNVDEDPEICLGDECPYHNCEVCNANKTRLMATDRYRQSVAGGYYSSSLCRDKSGKIIGYNKPGE